MELLYKTKTHIISWKTRTSAYFLRNILLGVGKVEWYRNLICVMGSMYKLLFIFGTDCITLFSFKSVLRT
jgi:hypothetical protein